MHVLHPGLRDLLGHAPNPRRSPDLERLPAAVLPGREHEVRQADGVVGVQVGDEHPVEPPRLESREASLRRGSGAADDSRPGVDEVGLAADDHGDARTGALRIGDRRARAEHDQLHRTLLSRRESRPGDDKSEDESQSESHGV